MVRREVSVTSFFLFCGSVAFLASALSTQYWISSEPELPSVITNGTAKKGCVHYGLFKGVMDLPSYIVSKPETYLISVVCSTKESVCMFSHRETSEQRQADLEENLAYNGTSVKLIPLGQWATTLVFAALALVLGLVGAVFAVINSVMTPLDFLTGLQGLWIWSGIGALFGLLAVILWGAAFEKVMKHNVMTKTFLELRWDSAGGKTYLGHSYWFVFVATLFHLANVVCVLLLLHKPWKKDPNAARIKPDEGTRAQEVMMY